MDKQNVLPKTDEEIAKLKEKIEHQEKEIEILKIKVKKLEKQTNKYKAWVDND